MAPDPEQDVRSVQAAYNGHTDAADVTGQQRTAEAPRAAPPFTFYRSIAYAAEPQLFTWCARVGDAGAFGEAAAALGLRVSSFPGSRLTPAGVELRWDLIVVSGHGLGGAVPFFIDWHESTHPAAALQASRADQRLALVELVLRHPDAAALRNLLHALREAGGVDGSDRSEGASPVVVEEGDSPLVLARLRGPTGPFELSGPGGTLIV